MPKLKISPLGAERCGSRCACAHRDSAKGKCLWHERVQRITRSDKRGGAIFRQAALRKISPLGGQRITRSDTRGGNI